MKVYKDRFANLRAIAEIAAARGDDEPFIVYGERRIGFGEFFRLANAVSAALGRRRRASATATGWRCCRPTTPSGA